MSENKNFTDAADWEFSEDFYREKEGAGALRFEDFLEPETLHTAAPEASGNDRLIQISRDVERVIALAGQGSPIDAIAEKLCLDRQYVYTILACAQGFSEDDPIAVAHLVMMEE